MLKIKKYLFTTALKYLILNQLIILFLIIFLNIIELSRMMEGDNKNLYNFIYLSFLKIPSTINESSPFVIIISMSFLFKYLISYNELISMRNVGLSIFDIFQSIALCVFIYGLLILLLLNPLSALSEIKYDKFLDKKNPNLYSIKFLENSLWIKNKNINDAIQYINIEKFNIKDMLAENIKILLIDENNKNFIVAKEGKIDDQKFILYNANYFNIIDDSYEFKEILKINLNFSKDNILSSVVNYKNVPYYNYINHISTLKKFNLYSSSISLHYLSEILKPFFMVLLSFFVMGFSAKYKKNEGFFKVLFYAVLFGFCLYIFRELVNKITLTFNTNFIFSYLIIFIVPFIIGLYKVIQIEND